MRNELVMTVSRLAGDARTRGRQTLRMINEARPETWARLPIDYHREARTRRQPPTFITRDIMNEERESISVPEMLYFFVYHIFSTHIFIFLTGKILSPIDLFVTKLQSKMKLSTFVPVIWLDPRSGIIK